MKKGKITLPNYYVILVAFFCVQIICAQQKQFTIKWEGTKVLSTGDYDIEIPNFNKKNFSYNDTNGLEFHSQWKSNTYIDEASFTISNIVYSPINVSQLKDLDVSKIPNSIKASLKNSIARDDIYTFLNVSPIIKESGQFKKVMSFTINYTAGKNVNTQRNTQTISNSVLKTGVWKKFYVDTTGVFKLSKSFIESLGINTDVDPRTLKIYGNGGRMLPLLNIGNEPLDPIENAIKVVGEEDGVFNNDDYILFYAEGPFEFNEESGTNVNIFTEKTYYYITAGPGFGKRIQEVTQPANNANVVLETFQDYQFHEIDEENLGSLGRKWFGNSFQIENIQTFAFNFPNLVTTRPIDVTIRLGSITSSGNTSMNVKINNEDFYNVPSFSAITGGSVGSVTGTSKEFNVNSDEVVFTYTYSNGGNPSSKAFIDYMSIEATRDLIYTQNFLRFYNNSVANTSGIVEYKLNNASTIGEVWDVTDIYNVGAYTNIESAETFSFKTNAGELRTYVAFNDSDVLQPESDNTNVSNQDIKGTIFNNDQGQFQDVDYIIITRADMLSQANRLAQINKDRYNLNVKVIDQEMIYAEFNNGNTDIAAIRNFVKYVYDNASTPANRLKYLCLFGDGSYDYKDRISNNTNIVPSWYALNSTSETSSFVSDDFYGMMDFGEGSMDSSNLLDIATGRILADTPQRAVELVDKIEDYYANEALGEWRNNFIAISDDVDEAWEATLQTTTDLIANLVSEQKPSFNAVKVHSDAFQQEASSAGERYPAANQLIKDKIDVGASVVNYFGHGGEDGLANERIFDKNNAQDIRNVCKLNCFVTVTCEYTKFDNPNRITAGELTYWNKEAGAVSLITTTRAITVTAGRDINTVLTGYMFGLGGLELTSVAEALRRTKVDPEVTTQERNLVFFIGDPAMKITFPRPGIRLTKINDVPITESTEVLQALSTAKITGEIVDDSGAVLNNFNGELSAIVYDKLIDRQTLGNNNVMSGGDLIILDFQTLGEAIFRGKATVENGEFEFNFVVPKDIGVPVGKGKISFYAKANEGLVDYAGANLDVEIGGIDENAEEDTIGPNITLFMNDESFVSGGITNEQPTLIAKLFDDHGINTASGIGHDIVAIIDGQETSPFVLNEYYKADVDDYQNGTVSFQFRDLEPGLHTLSFKAWDVYNNSATQEVQFVVRDKDESLVVESVLNYPNPFVNYTEFWFKHNSSDVLDISVQIFTVSGKLVKTLNGQTSAGSKDSSALSRDIVWDGRDDFGDKIGKGVYIYKLKVRSSLLNKQVEKIEKLVIL